MAAYISVPRDLANVKTKVAFNLTKRQLICFGAAALVGVPLFFVLRDVGGNTAATLGMMIVMLPAFFLGMYQKNGQPAEKLLRYYVQAKFLLRNGADEVVYPEKQLAKWTAIRYSADHILDYIELDSDHAMFEIPVPENWAGRSIGQIDIRKKYNINIIGIKKNGKLELSISPDVILASGETMLVLGRNKDLQKCFHI